MCWPFSIFCPSPRRLRWNPAVGLVSETVGSPGPTPDHLAWVHTKGETILALTLTTTQQVSVSISPTDKRGHPANLDGAPVWSADNTDAVALTPAPDGLSCLIVALGPVGPVDIFVDADADLGAGVTPLRGTFQIEIVAAQATTIEVTPGSVEEQP